MLQEILTTRELPGPSSAEEIREAFAVFDKMDNGTVSAKELRHILMTTGERLSEEEADQMLAQAQVDADGEVKYEQFVQAMLQTK